MGERGGEVRCYGEEGVGWGGGVEKGYGITEEGGGGGGGEGSVYLSCV